LNTVLNSPSKVWGSIIKSRREEREKIERESLHLTCCEVAQALKNRDHNMVGF